MTTRRMRGLFLLLSVLSVVCDVASLKLNVTAIGARHGSSTLECWQLDNPFVVSDEPGTAGSAQVTLGEVANISYSLLPAKFDGGVHNAPHNQWVIFTSGLAFITLPDDKTTSAYVSGGEFGLIFAADTQDVSSKGHRTQYPGTVETVGIQIPTPGGTIPEHDVLHMGPCDVSEIAGIRGLGVGSSDSD
ncbi:hypothetical protein GGR50DRAFT_633769 [Xylaria sp. CBS 124048]|nr:hypothetical protein GGR50DRAFT_633769 [Xylaria sp. CBS 124048]